MFILCVLLIFTSGIYVFCSMRKHLLLTLLRLEFLALSLYYCLFIFLCYYGISYYFILIFLTFVVCEGALGLGILVCLIRGQGGDNISRLSILGW